jgi:RHS repeat-associated protein
VVDNSSVVKDTLVYDGFGNITSETSSSFRGRYVWTGRELDTETALQYNRDRYYDSSTGKWMSEDPLGFRAGDSNLYRYVHNKAPNARDPSGRYFFLDDLVFIVGGALVGVGTQLVSDIIDGRPSSFGDYVASLGGGAVAGEVLLYTGPFTSGAAGGATYSIIKQGFDGKGIDPGTVVKDAVLGGTVSKLSAGIKLYPFSSGRWNYNSQQYLRLINGRPFFQRVRPSTAMKMFLGRGMDQGLFTGMLVSPGANSLLIRPLWEPPWYSGYGPDELPPPIGLKTGFAPGTGFGPFDKLGPPTLGPDPFDYAPPLSKHNPALLGPDDTFVGPKMPPLDYYKKTPTIGALRY